MSGDIMELVAEFRKLERKRTSSDGKLSSKEEKRHAQIKRYLDKAIHGIDSAEESERRDDLRVPISMRARYSTGDAFAHNYISNLSSGGVFISTSKPLPLDTKVKLIIVIEDDKIEVEIEGKVVWENTQKGQRSDATKAGMGIKFTRIEPEAQDKINDLVHVVLEEKARLKQEQEEAGKMRKERQQSEKRVKGFFRKK